MHNIEKIKFQTIKQNLITDTSLPSNWKRKLDFNNKYLSSIAEEPGYKNLIINYSDNIQFKGKLKEDLRLKLVKPINKLEKPDLNVLKNSLYLHDINNVNVAPIVSKQIYKNKTNEKLINNNKKISYIYCKKNLLDNEYINNNYFNTNNSIDDYSYADTQYNNKEILDYYCKEELSDKIINIPDNNNYNNIVRFKSYRKTKDNKNKNDMVLNNIDIKFKNIYNKLITNKLNYSNKLINTPIDNSLKSKNLKYDNILSKIKEEYNNKSNKNITNNLKVKKQYIKRKRKLEEIKKKYNLINK